MPRSFLMSVKVSRFLTHMKRLRDGRRVFAYFNNDPDAIATRNATALRVNVGALSGRRIAVAYRIQRWQRSRRHTAARPRPACFLRTMDYERRAPVERRIAAVTRQVEAIHAFHTGLIAETGRHTHVLAQMTQHIALLRQPEQPPQKKLAAAKALCRHLATLEQLKRPWADTHRDFRLSLRRALALYREIVKTSCRVDH
jgi:hypothetical protein